MKRNANAKALVAWRASTVSLVDAGTMASGLLASEPEAAEQREEVKAQVLSVATSLDQASGEAPTAETRDAAKRTADGLRNVIFAQEANRLLREGTRTPTAQQLGEADAALRARNTELEIALNDLNYYVNPPAPA